MITALVFIATGIAAALAGSGIIGLGLVLFGFGIWDDAKARRDQNLKAMKSLISRL